MEKTKIGEREVPIKPGAKTIVRFSGDPGERWRRMAGAKGYEKLYASAAQYMRPASAAKVEVGSLRRSGGSGRPRDGDRREVPPAGEIGL